MSYFPTDIPFMSEEELKANGIKVNCFMSEGELKANGAKINCSEKPNNSNLRKRPFCGGNASLHFDPEGVKDTMGRKWAYTITCNRCAASSGLCFSMEQAVDAWNRRAE